MTVEAAVEAVGRKHKLSERTVTGVWSSGKAAMPMLQQSILTPTRIAAARGVVSMSQDALAKAVGISSTALSKIEKGDSNPRPVTLARILKAFESAGVVFKPEPALAAPARDPTPEEEKLFERLRELGRIAMARRGGAK